MQARQPSLLRTAYLLTGDRHTAEDLVQTALAKLYLSWDRVQRARTRSTATSGGSWSTSTTRCGAAVEAARVRHRRPARRRPVTDEYDEGQRAAVWDAVQTLPRKARAVVVLRYYEQLSEAETAEALGISVGTVKSQASRALAALRERAPQHLNPLNHEEER